MFKNLGLKGQILVPVCGLISIILLGLISAILATEMQVAEKKAVELSKTIGKQYSLEIKSELDIAMDAARNLSHTFQSLQSGTNVHQLKRAEYTDIIRSIFKENSNFFGMGSIFEPNALDGKDIEYKNTSGHDKTGRFIPYWVREDGRYKLYPAVDYEEEKNADFYSIPKRTKKEVITEPYEYGVGNKKVFMTTLVSPVLEKQNQQFMGVTAVDISLEQIQKIVSAIKPFDGGYAYLVSHQGIFVSHPNRELIGKSMTRRVTGDQRDKMAQAISNGKPYQFFWTHPNGTEYIQVLTPIQIGKTTTPWSLGIGIPIAKVTEGTKNRAILFLTLAILAIVILSGIIFLIINRIVKRIYLSVNLAQKIARGNLNHSFNIKGKNELSVLAHALKDMVMSLKKKEELAQQIAKGDLTQTVELASKEDGLGKALQTMQVNLTNMLHTVQQNSTTLSSSLTELSTISNKISNATTEMSSQSNSVAGASEEMSAGINTLSGSNSEMNANVQSIAATSTEVSQNMTEISNGIDQLAGAIQQVSDKSVSAQGIAKQAIDISTLSTKKMNELDQSASKIGEFSQIIKEIAQQTNLLALNANIEAASAGDAGKGFAVVANEIKELANQSSHSAEDISITISEIENNIESSVASMRDVAKIIETIDQSTKEILDLSQSSTGNVNQMVNHVKESTVGVEDVSKLINEISVVTESTAHTSEEFSSSIGEISKNMQELNKVVSETVSGVNQVSSETISLSKVSEDLHQVVSQFKLEK